MKRLIAFLLVLIFAVLLPATSSLAGSRYYSSRYYGGYRSHYPHYYPYHYRHSYPYHYRHSHHSDDLAYLGVGLLTGAVIGSILYQPPVQRTVVYSAPPVVYSTPPPVVVHRSPVVAPHPQYSPDSEVLRQVRPTVRILNLRSGPGLDEEVIGQASFGEILGVIGAAPEWLYVKTQTGQYGWVMTQYTQALEGPVG